MTMNTLRPDEKGYHFDHARLVMCRLAGLEFSPRFKDMLLHGFLADGSGHDEEVHIMLAPADVEVLASFLAGCQVRLREFSGGPIFDGPVGSVDVAATSGTDNDRA